MAIKLVIIVKANEIVVQSHNPKTYICLNSDNTQQEVLITSYHPTLPLQVQRSKCTKNRDLHTTFFNTKAEERHNFQGTSPIIFSFKRVRWISFVNKCD